ncbi:transmembrane protein, putative (macronuclear) [Tetrahymena thermophila SB210]|uniref:Transmembrane protein, putative n=1 Tax=Tetrahymena thermophila (strain SB210) TaxID=312017 RepID=I7MN21_TETTS|nr:transmembrane protein, putative [Tetrahymena thermophila SB210]EAS07754.1 transmembrane protein, putative [Tetrahymena thermophila SB210]|eukprot:XP_001027996.1 transmembrane protein, putative [Tetrahymena thermophila SB210]
MTITKKNTFSLLIISASFILTTHALLEIPLKFDREENSILFNANFGTENCKIEAKAEFYYCSNEIDFIRTDYRKIQTCGAVPSGTTTYGVNDYEAQFQMGNFQARVVFAQYNTLDNLNLTLYTRSLCFGKVNDDTKQLSLLKQLNQEGLISQPRVYITFFNKYLSYFTSDDIIGQINLGEPNPEFIKKGSSFVKMYVDKSDTYVYDCTFYSNGETTYFGQKISGYKKYYINFDSALSSIDLNVFEQMLAILKERGYQITVSGIGIFKEYYIDTIEGLEPIKITILTEDMSPYILSLVPSVYTKKIVDGIYRLMFKVIDGERAFIIGNQILTSYYFAYDANTQNTFFAERVENLNPQLLAQKSENFSKYLREEKV